MTSKAPRAGVRFTLHVAVLIAAIATGACGAGRGDDRGPALTLWLGGDVHLAAGDDADRRLAALAPFTADAVGVVNLEGPVTDTPARDGELASAPDRLAGLLRAGVAVVGIANNHALDGGAGAPAATITAVRRAGLLAAGGPAGHAIVERHGVRVAITAHDLAPRAEPDATTLTADLAAARAQADVLVATFHVTGPPSYLPPREAVTAAAIARAAGATAIAFHGSHALARVERDAGTITAWGLGNLLFTCDCTDEEDALLLRITVSRRGLVDAELVPVAAGLRGAAARPAADPALIYDLLRSLRSTPLDPAGPRARVSAPPSRSGTSAGWTAPASR